MKFARLLRTTAEDLPELSCLFHIYKHLKKQLKQLPARSEGKGPGPEAQTPNGRGSEEPPGGDAHASNQDTNRAAAEANEEARFTAVLTDHLQRLNDRFLEREETCVIQLERLEAEAAQCTQAAKAALGQAAGEAGPSGSHADDAGSSGDGVAAAHAALKAVSEQRAQLYKRFVNFHGEVLLLVHWSVLAYTATVKILKKHHKRTGLLLRAPQLADLLSQPFCSSELMTGLARKAEACIQRLAEQLAASATSGGTTDGDTGGIDGAAAAAAGGLAKRSDPQDTVEQQPLDARAHGGGLAVGPFGAAGGLGDDDSYGVTDGSSPSCSQSLGEQALGVGALASRQDAVPREQAPARLGPTAQRRKRHRAAAEEPPPAEEPEREDAAVPAPGADGTGAGTRRGSGAPAAGGAGGGASCFLRTLTNISDNSAASLSGPYMLEQLAELQQYVDKYDNEDDDVDLDDDLDDAEEDSAATAAANAAAAEEGHPCSRGRGHHQQHHHQQQRHNHNHAGGDNHGQAPAGAADGPPAQHPQQAADQQRMQEQPEAQAAEPPAAGGSRGVAASPGAEAESGGTRAQGHGGAHQHRHLMRGDVGWASRTEQAEAAAAAVAETATVSEGYDGTGQDEQQQGLQQQAPLRAERQAPKEAARVSGAAAPEGDGLDAAAVPDGMDADASVQPLHPQPPAGVTLAAAAVAPENVSGSGQISAAAQLPLADQARPQDAQQPNSAGTAIATTGPGAPPQSSSGSAAAFAGGAGSTSVGGLSENAVAAFAVPRPLSSEAGASNLLRRTQVALTMWEQLRANASTPSTVIDPSASGQQQPQQQQPQPPQAGGTGSGGAVAGEPRGKRMRMERGPESPGNSHPGVLGQTESVADDSDSNSD